jgi:hypothetical protein
MASPARISIDRAAVMAVITARAPDLISPTGAPLSLASARLARTERPSIISAGMSVAEKFSLHRPKTISGSASGPAAMEIRTQPAS